MNPPMVKFNPHPSSFGSHTSESSAVYPTPLEVPPLESHKMTFIILHGRGDEANAFGTYLLGWNIANRQNLRVMFPTAKFVFPTAALRRAQSSNRSMSHQWFDNHSPLSVEEQCRNEEWQIEGLRETCKFIHGFLRHEISQVGASNVVLGGLSQGCASSLIALLLWDGPPLKAMFGMCGWLPLRKRMEDIARSSHLEKHVAAQVEFRSDGDVNASVSEDGCTQALQYLGQQLDLHSDTPAVSYVFQQMPIFLGHGLLDFKVPLGLHTEAVGCLKLLGASIEVKQYQDLGHWYSSEMLEDITNFLKGLENQNR